MKTMVICRDTTDGTAQRIAEVLRSNFDQRGPVLAVYNSFEPRISSSAPELVLVVLTPDIDEGLEVVRKVRVAHKGSLVAVGPASDPKLILRALQIGLESYLDETAVEHDLVRIIARLEAKEEPAAATGVLIALLGASGGSGTSTLAVNIAATLAKECDNCGLVDLKPGRGDLAALLDLKPAFSLADICLNGDRLDRSMFDKILCTHSSHIRLLAASQIFGSTRMVTTRGVDMALSMARRQFSCVVADLEDCFHEEQVVALRQASAILVVVRLDFTSLRNVRRILEHLQEQGIDRGRVQLVINRHGQANELPVHVAEEALGKLAHLIPDDPKNINAANNTGVPVVLKSPHCKATKAITKLALDVFDRRKGGQIEMAPVPVAGRFARFYQVFGGRAAL